MDKSIFYDTIYNIYYMRYKIKILIIYIIIYKYYNIL